MRWIRLTCLQDCGWIWRKPSLLAHNQKREAQHKSPMTKVTSCWQFQKPACINLQNERQTHAWWVDLNKKTKEDTRIVEGRASEEEICEWARERWSDYNICVARMRVKLGMEMRVAAPRETLLSVCLLRSFDAEFLAIMSSSSIPIIHSPVLFIHPSISFIHPSIQGFNTWNKLTTTVCGGHRGVYLVEKPMTTHPHKK